VGRNEGNRGHKIHPIAKSVRGGGDVGEEVPNLSRRGWVTTNGKKVKWGVSKSLVVMRQNEKTQL